VIVESLLIVDCSIEDSSAAFIATSSINDRQSPIDNQSRITDPQINN